MSKFARAARNMIARMIPDNKLEEVRRLFVKLDRDNDGMMGYHELKGVFELKSDTFEGFDVKTFDWLCRRVDVSKSGGINYTEFLALMLDDRVARRRSMCREAFNVFAGSAGHIDAESLAKALGGEMSADQCHFALREAGYDGFAEISFEDFCSIVTGDATASKQKQSFGDTNAVKLNVLREEFSEIRRSCFM